jgi:uncharacterized membrane protein
MLVAVFDDETKAYEGSEALKELDSEGSVSVHSEAVVKKNPDGSLTTKEISSDFPIRTVGGTAIGALIGVLGGPIGLGLGTATGALAGYMADLHRAGVDADYVDEVTAKLTPGKWAVVSDISEEWETPVDTKMGSLGGSVFRATRESVQKEQDARDEAALKAEMAHLKEEQTKAGQKDKAKIQAKIDGLDAKLRMKIQKAKERSEQERKETETKIKALEEKAKKASGDTKAKIQARIASLREKHK